MNDHNRRYSNNGYNPHKDNKQNNEKLENPDVFFNKSHYQSRWITEGADEALIIFAEEAGKYMFEGNLTNSKIRSIYGEIKRIQMGKFEENKPSFYLLRPKVAYALGREKKNNKNNKGLELFKIIFDECSKEVSDEETFNNFCNLFEAILAYHKAHGGKD